MSSIIFVLFRFGIPNHLITNLSKAPHTGGKCLTCAVLCGMISLNRVWERQRCLIFLSGSGAHSCSLADLDYHYFPLFSLHSSSTELYTALRPLFLPNRKPHIKPITKGIANSSISFSSLSDCLITKAFIVLLYFATQRTHYTNFFTMFLHVVTV